MSVTVDEPSLAGAVDVVVKTASSTKASRTPDRIWSIQPEVLAEIVDYMHGRMPRAQIEAMLAAAPGDEEPARSGSVAVIPLQGVITPRSSIIAQLFGGGSGLDVFRDRLMAAANSADVETILLNVDSPGGQVSLVPETAAMIRAVGEQKKIVAHANVLAASAAYWLASQADEIVVSPSGEAGSIGVVLIHEDISGAAEQAGVNLTLISAGRRKTEGNPFEPLSDEARASLQADVDTYYGMFVADVAAGRGVKADAVRSGFGEGGIVLAAEALEAGIADKIEPIEQTLSRLGGESAPETSGQDRVAVARLLLP